MRARLLSAAELPGSAGAAARPAQLFGLRADCVLYRDEALIVIDKPAGIPCQFPDASQPEDVPGLLAERLALEQGVASAEVYLGTHQRLDQETSGVLLYSLSRTANAALAEQFQSRSLEKRYLAAVSGKPPPPGSLLEHWLVPDADGRMRVGRAGEPRAKQAKTRVLGVRRSGERSLLELAIDTGRTHQIRVQLAAVGCPVAGDRLYGGAPALRLLLHASSLRLRHPLSDTPLQLEAACPLELCHWVDAPQRSIFQDPALLARSLELAAARRVGLMRAYAAGQTTVFRWVHAEADGLPDTYVDVYNRHLVVRVDGDDRGEDERALLAALSGLGFAGAYLKRHPRQANQIVDPRDEQFAPRAPVFGSAAPEVLEVHEHGVPYEVRLAEGLRTGLFLDQRDNRALILQLARDKRVLNLFGYTGSFSVAALVGGAAHAVTVDVSRTALEWAERNVARVQASARHTSIAEDAFVALRSLSARAERFDCAILDPPSYSTSKHGRFRVVKDYTALCAATLRVLAPSAVLIACVNHHGVSRDTLRRFVRAAAREAGCAIESMRDLPTQRDFPLPSSPDAEPDMKSVLVRLAASSPGHASRSGERTRLTGMRNPSAGMKRRKWSG